MKKSVLKLIVGIVAFAATTAITQADTAATTVAPATPPDAFDDFVQQAKNPTDWLTWDWTFVCAMSISTTASVSEQRLAA